jgi:hypothetical protein
MLAMVLPRRHGNSAMEVPSHAGVGPVEVTWPRHDVYANSCWRHHSRVTLAMVLLRQLGRGAMLMLSHAGDNATESCWR